METREAGWPSSRWARQWPPSRRAATLLTPLELSAAEPMLAHGQEKSVLPSRSGWWRSHDEQSNRWAGRGGPVLRGTETERRQ